MASQLEEHDPERREVLLASRVTAGTPAAACVRPSDLLLRIDGTTVSRFGEVLDASVQGPVTLGLFRDGEELACSVESVAQESDVLDRVVLWSGALLQTPHRAIAAQRGQPRDGVYVAFYWYGSPAGRYKLRPLRRIVAVDDKDIADLDEFLSAVGDKGHGDAVRIRTMDLQGREQTLTLKLDQSYWPTRELHREDGRWVTH